jgi:Zn-dependent peptidase ImmA (M78 family)
MAKLAGAILRSGDLPDNLSGFLLRQAGGAVIGVNAEHADTRQRFTIAHEIGHLLLHPDQSYLDRKILPAYFRDDRSRTAEDKVEIDANQFAADLLMPKRFLLRALANREIDVEDADEVSKLAKRFGVSPQALTYRLINLELAQSASIDNRRTRP